jgi:hypothetical protein
MHTRHVKALYDKAADSNEPVVALIPTQSQLPPVDPYAVSRRFAPGARFTVEALAVGLRDFYTDPRPEVLDRIRLDLDTARAIFNQED